MVLHPVQCGNFKLDGGAMFGVVPKVIWNKTNPADNNNLVKVSCRSLLIEEGNKLILIDTGMGNKQSEKFFNYYHRWGNYSLETSLENLGFHFDDITDVFFTHLHFDHCGGAIKRNEKGELIPAFKNASFWTHKKHWDWAINPNPREKASFLLENILPIQKSGQLNFIEGDELLIENSTLGFEIIIINGHTERQMLPVIKYRGKKIIFSADLIPTVGHIPLPFVMGYDVRPLKTMEEKKLILNLINDNGYLLFMEHDPNHELISVCETEKGIRMNKSYKLGTFF